MSWQWTEQRIDRLTELAAACLSASQIAILMDSTRNGIIGACHRHGVQLKGTHPFVANKPKVKRERHVGGGKLSAIHRARDKGLADRPPIMDRVGPGLKPKEDTPIPSARMVPLLLLKDHGECKWPCGEPTDPTFGFCALPATGEGPYCIHHMRLAYAPAPRRARSGAKVGPKVSLMTGYA